MVKIRGVFKNLLKVSESGSECPDVAGDGRWGQKGAQAGRD